MPAGENLTRRDLIRVTAAAAGAEAVRAAVPDLKFFTREEFALVDELSELMIPSDEHSPGARAAQVAAYIDARLAESLEDPPKRIWRDGLKRMDALSRESNGHPVLEAEIDQRMALLEGLAANEQDPKTPDELFFRELKARTAHAYYTSKIGIHQELEYKGNVPLPEFLGYEVK